MTKRNERRQAYANMAWALLVFALLAGDGVRFSSFGRWLSLALVCVLAPGWEDMLHRSWERLRGFAWLAWLGLLALAIDGLGYVHYASDSVQILAVVLTAMLLPGWPHQHERERQQSTL